MPMLAVTSASWPSRWNGAGQGLEHAATELLGTAGSLETDLDDRELVAADPRDGVGLANAGAEPLGALLEQQVADRMAQGVVDVLEAIEIEAQDRSEIAAPADARHRLLEALLRAARGWAARSAGRAGRDTGPGARPRSRR